MNQIEAFHNSQSMLHRRPFGAVELGMNVCISIDINKKLMVKLIIYDFNGEKEYINMDSKLIGEVYRYTARIKCNRIGVQEYLFEIADNSRVLYYGNNIDGLGGIGRLYSNEACKKYQITVSERMVVPKWYKEGIIYQIFVDRFKCGTNRRKIKNAKVNSFIYGSWDDKPLYIKDDSGRIVRWDFYGGNLEGIISKLDYISELGATIIYLNPIFESSSCHKYDVGDYEKVDSMFGSIEEFKLLCNESEKRGIKIILDGVFSHTGADSKYFNKNNNYNSIGAYQSTESKYYKWYRFKNYPNDYECWWGILNQPNVDELEPTYLEYIATGDNSIIRRWIKYGASGWRLDVADELPDEFIRILKEEIKKEKSDAILIGEVWEDASNKVSYDIKRKYLLGEELDSVTNYPFRECVISFLLNKMDAYTFKRKIMSLYENYPIENFYSNMNLLGSHDTKRVLTALNNDEELLKMAIVIQMTFPGVPTIYYGDEVGILGGLDPDNRRTYPWGMENQNIYNWYQLIISIRTCERDFISSNLNFYDSKNSEVLIYIRESDREKYIIVINNGIYDYRLTLNNGEKVKDLIKHEEYMGIVNIVSKDIAILKEIR